MNFKRAFDNLDFTRKGDIVRKENINNVNLLLSENDVSIYQLVTHDNVFYEVHRVEFKHTVQFETNGFFHVCMLVEGESVNVTTRNGYVKKMRFGETFIVPAAAHSYEIANLNLNTICKLVKAFVKKSIF